MILGKKENGKRAWFKCISWFQVVPTSITKNTISTEEMVNIIMLMGIFDSLT